MSTLAVLACMYLTLLGTGTLKALVRAHPDLTNGRRAFGDRCMLVAAYAVTGRSLLVTDHTHFDNHLTVPIEASTDYSTSKFTKRIIPPGGSGELQPQACRQMSLLNSLAAQLALRGFGKVLRSATALQYPD